MPALPDGWPPCRICELPVERGQAFAAWLPPTATDWGCWQGPPDATHVCEPCIWVRAGRPESPPAMGSGRWPVTLRLLAHVWDEQRGWRWYTKGQKRELLADLLSCLDLPRDSRWFAAVPESGQKHSLIYSPINRAGLGSPGIAFEVEVVRLGLFGGRWSCMDAVRWAYDAGWSKAEILVGQAGPRRMATIGVEECRSLAACLRPFLSSAELELAVWLVQRTEEDAEDGRADDAGQHHQHLDGRADRPGPGLPGQAADDVAAPAGHDVCQRPADQQAGSLVHNYREVL